MSEPPRSQHPTDRLIRELVATGRQASDGEVHAILDRIAMAPFLDAIIRVPTDERGTMFMGRRLAAREPSLDYHVFKRTVSESQWAVGTSLEGYVEDLQRVSSDPLALTVYQRRGGPMLAVIGSTAELLSQERRGASWEPLLGVFYSADRGTFVSGYQATYLAELAIPEEAQWLVGRPDRL